MNDKTPRATHESGRSSALADFVQPFVSGESVGRSIVLALTALAILTTSFDIFANVVVANYTVRLTQLASLPLVFLATKTVFGGKDRWPVGAMWLLAWCAVQLLLAFRSPSLTNGIGYWCWLMLDVCIVLGLPTLVDSEDTYAWIARFYLNSFFVIAIVGLLQFALHYVGIDICIAHVMKSGIARINGFSYEASYYATYMLMGFVLNGYLLEKEDFSLLSKKSLARNYVFMLLAIALTNSRMGYLVVGVWLVFRLVAMLVGAARARRRGETVQLPLVFWLTLAAVFAGAGLLIAMGMNTSILLRGFGIVGKASASSGDRIRGFMSCLQLFVASPVLGYGLGGVDPAIAQMRGGTYTSGDNGAAMSTVGEMLAANGIVGLIPLVAYVRALFFGDARHVARKDSPWHTLHTAMLWALLFEIFILAFNQNILRPYFWMQIAFVTLSWKFVSQSVSNAHIDNGVDEPSDTVEGEACA